MRSPAILILLAAVCSAIAQTPSEKPVQPSADALTIMNSAAPLYDFSNASLRPFHVKATYQLYGPDGNRTEQGVWEYWWGSPKENRATWTRLGASRTDWSIATGARLQKQSGEPLHYFERSLFSYALDPLPSYNALFRSGEMKLGLNTVSVENLNLTCVSTQVQWSMNGQTKVPVSAEPEEYCFDPSSMALRIKSLNHLISEYNDFVKLQGRHLARKVTVVSGKQTLFSVSIDEISDLDTHSDVLNPPPDAKTIASADLTQNAPSEVTPGALVKESPPHYPFLAKANRIKGTVVLAAVIGKDGKIRDLEVLMSPDRILSESALNAVKRWEYKPYLLNGAPVEVETMINVVFNLGG